MNAATLRLLVEKGLSASDIVEIAESLEAAKPRSTNAERQARFRARRKQGGVTSNVTRNALPPPNDIYSNPPVSSDDETKPVRAKGPARPEGVSEQTWSDFVAHRKSRKAPVTPTAIEGIRREAEKIGWTLEAALAEAVTRGWQGFKADWIDGDRKAANDSGNGFLAHKIRQRQQARDGP